MNKVTRGAILIAIAIVLQMSFREVGTIFPAARLLVGISVNACLLLTLYYSNKTALFINAILPPIIAVYYGALPNIVFIYPVIAANLAYAFSFAGFTLKFNTEIGAAFLSTLMRSATFGIVGLGTLMLFSLQKIALHALIPLTIVQLLTGFVGGLLAIFVHKRIGDHP